MKPAYLISLLLSSVLALPSSNRGSQASGPNIGRGATAAKAERRSQTGSPGHSGFPFRPNHAHDGCQISYHDKQSYCAPPVEYNPSKADIYLCGDWRLGPTKPPSIIQVPVVAELTDFYRRFGDLCPAEFLEKYWDPQVKYWFFPGHDGFSLDVGGQPITGIYTLEVGTLVDRFGGPGGKFVSPAAALYIERALPPNNLETSVEEPRVPNSYHLYSVEIEFTVEAGPIAPWFEQPGQGVQYHLPNNQTVQNLIDSGHLVERNPLVLEAQNTAGDV